MPYSAKKAKKIAKRAALVGTRETALEFGISESSVERVVRMYRVRKEQEDEGPKTGPNILLFDIETAPLQAWVWSMWNEVRDYKFITNEWYVLSFAWKWLGGQTTCNTLLDNPGRDKCDDSNLMKILHGLLDKADIVIAHNACKFDIRKVNARFVINDMAPPSPYKVVDTLKVAKRHFMFTSNRLDALGQQLGLGRKVDTGGFELWEGCMNGDKDSWDKMAEYNLQDVDLLEKVYLRLRPFMNNHPNYNVYSEKVAMRCPCCGGSVEENGYAYTNISRFVRYECESCGYWSRGRKNAHEKEKMVRLTTSVA